MIISLIQLYQITNSSQKLSQIQSQIRNEDYTLTKKD